MPATTEPSPPFATAVANVEVARRHRFGIVYPAAATAETDPVADAYRHGHTGALSPLIEVAEALLRPGDRVLDLGAHLGGFALAAAAMGCEVMAVEASADLAGCVRQSAAHNGFQRVHVVHCAVSDENGEVAFSAHGPWGHVATAASGHPAQVVAARRVDDLLREHGWDSVKLVKLDVEGSEIRALNGMSSLLSRPDAPVVFFESNQHTLALYGQNDAALKAAFRRAGYLIYRIVAPGTLALVEEGEEQAGVCCDYLAAKPPLPPPLQRWLSDTETALQAPLAQQRVDWIGGAGRASPIGGEGPDAPVVTAYADWAAYLLELPHGPLPAALVLAVVPPPDAVPLLDWFAQRGVLLGVTSGVARQLDPPPAWLGRVRLLLTDAEPVALPNLPPNASLHCFGGGRLPSVPEGCLVEEAATIAPVLLRQRQRVSAEIALLGTASPWAAPPNVESRPVATTPGAPAVAAFPSAASPHPPAVDRREKWLRRGLRMVQIPLIGPLFSWGWALLDLVTTRRKVLRIDERFAALIEVQGHAARDLRDFGTRLGAIEKQQAATAAQVGELGARLAGDVQAKLDAMHARLLAAGDQVEAVRRTLSDRLLLPGTELPYAFTRELPDLLDRARAGLQAPRTASQEELADLDVSQMWLGELGGPEAHAILKRQYDAYWTWLRSVEGTVLDVGCGAGEWLSFLGGLGKLAVGIDSNPHEVERCRRAKLNAHCADAFDWLAQHPGRYAAITLFQVIEHIARPRLRELIGLLADALQPGGLLLLETVNPAHPLAMSIFYNDPTHQRPLPVEYLTFLCQGAGLRPQATLYTFPVSVVATGPDWQATHYVNYTLALRKP